MRTIMVLFVSGLTETQRRAGGLPTNTLGEKAYSGCNYLIRKASAEIQTKIVTHWQLRGGALIRHALCLSVAFV